MIADDSMWYYAKGNQQYGPVSAAVVRGMLSSGELQPADLVWTTGMPEWREARVVDGLIAPPPPISDSIPRNDPFEQKPAPQPPPPPRQAPSWGGAPVPPASPPPANPYGPVGYQPPGYGESQHGKAVGAFVCSIFSILCAPAGIGLIMGIIAIVLSSTATSAMTRSGNSQGQGLAKAAFIIGIVGTALSFFVCGGYGAMRL